MVISFTSKKIRKTFSNEKALVREYGPMQARRIAQRLFELQAAENLETLRTLPQVRPHELSGDRAGVISLDIQHPYRLLLKPDYEEPPLKEDGGLDWKKVTKVRIVGVEDTHG